MRFSRFTSRRGCKACSHIVYITIPLPQRLYLPPLVFLAASLNRMNVTTQCNRQRTNNSLLPEKTWISSRKGHFVFKIYKGRQNNQKMADMAPTSIIVKYGNLLILVFHSGGQFRQSLRQLWRLVSCGHYRIDGNFVIDI